MLGLSPRRHGAAAGRRIAKGVRGRNTMLHGGINAMMHNSFGGLFGVLVLVGDIWAVINIFQSNVSNEKKLIWIVAVVLLPLLGLALWFFLGPRAGKSG